MHMLHVCILTAVSECLSKYHFCECMSKVENKAATPYPIAHIGSGGGK